MKFALASYGTRGDIEPCAAVGVELLRRGHEVCMAAPDNLVDFVDSVGLTAVPYGPNFVELMEPDLFRKAWRLQNPITLLRKAIEPVTKPWPEVSAALMTLADGADLLLTGIPYQEVVANVAEYYDIPFAALHTYPQRVNGYAVPIPPLPFTLPSSLMRSGMTVAEWVYWRLTKRADDDQRRHLGLLKATAPSSRRVMERGSLEIQTYEDFCFPEVVEEWGGRRPFVGALTMELPTDADDEVASWISAGTPPIYFGFGSMPVESPVQAVGMIAEACAELGERALLCSGGTDFSAAPHFEHVKVVAGVNHSAIFPACRAVVHHGGAGTTSAGLRAGIPTLILWIAFDQPIWADVVKRLKVGTSRRFSRTTRESLVADLRRILAPDYVAGAREVASRMSKPTASVTTAADLLEDTARRGRYG
ncbi:glycosyltransferase [Mycobacterium sp.]|uniref:glycosyltransferase n=1 Tax=Mycobacterium sp. TaxID=1785 RepID=UPI0025D1A8FB|nr:glycosyltransferase [Mycobacterium sp.]MBW0014819.1 glycosyltransferase [Mycobacterium sp.]